MRMNRRSGNLAVLLPLFVFSLASLPAEAGRQAQFLTSQSKGSPREIALAYIDAHQGELGLSSEDLSDIVVKDEYLTQHNGVTHIYIRQRFAGIEVVNGDININVTRDGEIINLGNGFVSGLAAAVKTRSPELDAQEAIERAADHLGLHPREAVTLVTERGGPAMENLFSGAGISQDDIPVKLMYYPVRRGEVRLVWSLVVRLYDNQNWWNVFVDAATGVIVEKINWIAQEGDSPVCSDCYEVYSLPKESPSDGPRTIEIDPADPVASPYGWHDEDGLPGADFTTARGNNVHAQTDHDANNRFPSGTDIRPDGGATREFLFPIDLEMGPLTYQEAAVANLFYWNNILHDIHYHYGFDEASGNFQQNNYGRGGLASDPVQADAQDGSGTNNANFATPPDGSDPRMQMFIWLSPFHNTLEVTSPPSIAGEYGASGADFGPPLDLTGISGNIVLAHSAVDTEVCLPATNGDEISGNIALIDRGTCNFVTKVRHAQNAGATAVVIVNNVPGTPITLADDGTGGDMTIPSGMISSDDGELIKAEILSGGESVAANFRSAGPGGSPNRDSDLDSGVIVHEYGHGVSNRLVGGPSNVGCLFNQEQMGEGWSDFHSLVFSAKPSDTATTPRGIGTYVIFEPPDGHGIRNFPYTTDLSVNPQTYEDIGSTNIPHGVGEIWASMLWEMYWALVEQYGFDADLYNGAGGNNLALQLVTDGMKLVNCRPSFVDARDAILLADQVNNSGANQCLIWKAFAKRGLGLSADAGSPFLVGDETEAFDIPPECATPPALSVGGSCPGLITLNVSGATPNRFLALAFGTSEGSFTLQSGACAGTELGLADPSLLTFIKADQNGDYSTAVDVGQKACGLFLQVLDRASCLPSNVAPIGP